MAEGSGDNVVDYFEVGSADGAAAAAFYGELFGWSIGDPSEQNYRSINRDKGGIWDTSAMGGATWGIFYVHVDDVEETIRRAQGLGARVVMPLVKGADIEFAHLLDLDGNRFAVWRPV